MSANKAEALSVALDTAKSARARNSIEKVLCHQLNDSALLPHLLDRTFGSLMILAGRPSGATKDRVDAPFAPRRSAGSYCKAVGVLSAAIPTTALSCCPVPPIRPTGPASGGWSPSHAPAKRSQESRVTSTQPLWRLVRHCLFCLLVAACGGTPTQPRDTTLPMGRWTGDGACLSVAADGCDLVVGCGHGKFVLPDVHADGTFAVNGTYRVEAGPISISPAPSATFLGVLTGQTLTLSVTPSDPSLRPASYVLRLTSDTGKCAVPCV